MCRSKARLSAGFLFLAVTLSGCAVILPQTYALKEQRPSDLPVRAGLTDVPFFAQEDYQCGPAALAMALDAAVVGYDLEQGQMIRRSGTKRAAPSARSRTVKGSNISRR